MKTLDAMADGGIHDHLAGGFHRYSTDRYWLVPHFEKMLYDNALLARVYADAYRATRMRRYAATARDTLDWILEEMTSPEGGFLSAAGRGHPRGRGLLLHLDARGGLRGPREGGRRDLLRALRRLARGELRGRAVDPQRHRHRREGPPQARAHGRPGRGGPREGPGRPAQGEEGEEPPARRRQGARLLERARHLRLCVRLPGLQDERYLSAATRSADFILTKLVKKGTSPMLQRRYRDGDVAIEGNLEDYSFLIAGLLDLYEASFEKRWMSAAIMLAEEMTSVFWDAERGGFFLTPPGGEIVAIKEGYDGPTPSGNSVAALDLLRLAEFTGNQDFQGDGRDDAEALRGRDGVDAHRLPGDARGRRLLLRLQGGRRRERLEARRAQRHGQGDPDALPPDQGARSWPTATPRRRS